MTLKFLVIITIILDCFDLQTTNVIFSPSCPYTNTWGTLSDSGNSFLVSGSSDPLNGKIVVSGGYGDITNLNSGDSTTYFINGQSGAIETGIAFGLHGGDSCCLNYFYFILFFSK